MANNGNAGKAVKVASILLAVIFLLAGVTKLAGFVMPAEQFVAWGYPAWFQYVIGGLETLAGVGFLTRRTRFVASAIVVVIMAGAIYTVVRQETAVQAAVPAVAMLLALFVAKKSR